METNVQVDKKPKKSKKFAAEAQTEETQAAGAEGAAEQEATEAIEKAKGAPRPRKWDYGIVDTAQIVRIAEAPRVAKNIQVAWENTDESPTVAVYFERYGADNRTDARHGLRVMARRKLIKLVHENGDEYPRDYVEPVKAEAPAETTPGATEETPQE